MVGILLVALYSPVWVSTVHYGFDFWTVLAAFALLVFWNMQPWLLVSGAGVLYGLLALLSR